MFSTKPILIQKFGEGDKIHEFKAPARINIIGEHVDYLGGYVLPAAISFEVRISIRKNNLNSYRIYSVQYDKIFSGSELIKQEKDFFWVNYILGIIDQFHKEGHIISGFDMVLDGNIPQGAGLSSSAAVEVNTAYAISKIFNIDISREKLALMGQAAENQFVGTNCGIMDQFIIANAKKDTCILLNTATLEKEYHKIDLKNFEFYLINSNVKHSLHDSDYNNRRKECESALAKAKKILPNLQNLYELEKIENSFMFDKNEIKRVQHVISEKNRTNRILSLFKSGSISEAAQILFEAHESLSKMFEVSCEEIDYLIQELKKQNVAGARMIGGGFGGCILVLDSIGKKEKITEELKEKYFAKFNLKAEIYSFQITEGVTELI
jgi:galactokinase